MAKVVTLDELQTARKKRTSREVIQVALPLDVSDMPDDMEFTVTVKTEDGEPQIGLQSAEETPFDLLQLYTALQWALWRVEEYMEFGE